MSIKRLFRAPQAKIKFSVEDFFGKYDKIHIFFPYLVKFTEEILNTKL